MYIYTHLYVYIYIYIHTHMNTHDDTAANARGGRGIRPKRDASSGMTPACFGARTKVVLVKRWFPE